jgi:tetratricopeptide (TPR) repeat protein
MTPTAPVAAETPRAKPAEELTCEQAAAAARLTAAAEALSVLRDRVPEVQHHACRFAMGLLSAHVAPEDWSSAGLPSDPGPPQQGDHLVPVTHPAVIRLARCAMQFYTAELRVADRPAHWARLAEFFARRLPGPTGELVRLRERLMNARVDVGDTSPAIISALRAAVDYHRAADGEDAYLTGLARANLSVAYRHRRTGTDLATATMLAHEEARARTARYGPRHSVTLVARSMHALSLLVQAEAAAGQAEQHALARRALAEITEVRAVRDRLFGVTSPTAIRSRRYEARALILLGELDKARACLECTLTFERARNGTRELQSSGHTHYQLGRVHCALGDSGKALEHAQHAVRILSAHAPGGRDARAAAALVSELRRG